MKHHAGRHGHIFQLHAGNDAPASHAGFVQDEAVFQVCAASHLRPLSHIAVMGGVVRALRSRCYHLLLPVQKFIVVHIVRYQPHQLRGGSEMDKFRRRQADQLHGKSMKRVPDLFSAGKKLRVSLPFRRLLIILLQRGMNGKGIQKIAVKADARPFVDELLKFYRIRPSVRADQAVKRLQQLCAQNHRAGVQIHVALRVHRSQRPQPFLALLVQEPAHIIVSVIQEDAVLLSGFHALLHGDRRRSLRVEINLQRVEQKQHVSGQNQHPLRNPGGNAGHADHELVKKRGAEAVGKLSWNRRKQLSAGGILGYPFAVAPGMDDQDPKPLKKLFCLSPLFPFLPRNVVQHVKRCPAGADPLSIRIRQHRIMSACRKPALAQPVIDLLPIGTRLFLVGGGQHQIIPFDKAGLCQAVFVVCPGIQTGLSEKKIFHFFTVQ